MAARLPQPGKDEGTWGDVLNGFLGIAHNTDGTIREDALTSREPAIGTGTTGQYLRGDKTWQALDKSAVGLGSVNNAAQVDLTTSQLIAGTKTFTGFVDKGGQVFNVKAYGATGDGTTDDSAAIAAALAAANTGNGGAVFFPRGSYKLTAALTLPDAPNVTILGSGKDVTTLLFDNLTSPAVVKAVPATRRFKYRIGNLSIDNLSRSNAGAVGVDVQRLANCTFSNLAISNFETAIRITDDSFFNLFHDIDVQEAQYGITFASGPNDKPNENVFYKVKLTQSSAGTGVDYPVVITNGNDNHFTNCSFEDFLTGVQISDIGNSFTNNRFECNRVGSTGVYVQLASGATNNSFLNNYYSGSAWNSSISISDGGAGNSFFEMSTYKDQFIRLNRNLVTAGDLAAFTRSGSGDLKAVVTAEDTYVNSGSPTQFLAKGVRSSGKFISGQLSGSEKFYVDATGQGFFNNGLAVSGAIDNSWSPNLYGLKSWSFDPVAAVNNTAPAGGTLQLVALRITKATTITHIYLFCSTAGSGTTNAYAALYDSGGNLLAQSDDQSANMASSGLKTFTLATPQAVSSGFVYVGFWATATTTVPAFSRGAGTNIVNALLGTSSYRYATANTGLTNTAPSPFGTKTSATIAYWVAVD